MAVLPVTARSWVIWDTPEQGEATYAPCNPETAEMMFEEVSGIDTPDHASTGIQTPV